MMRITILISLSSTVFASVHPIPFTSDDTQLATLQRNGEQCEEYTVKEGDTCHSISLEHEIATFSLLKENFLPAWCTPFPGSGTRLCVPPSCDVYTVKAADSCDAIVARHRGRFTSGDLLEWNDNLNSLCNNLFLLESFQICVSPPGAKVRRKRDLADIGSVVKIVDHAIDSGDPCAGDVPLPSSCWTSTGSTTTSWDPAQATKKSLHASATNDIALPTTGTRARASNISTEFDISRIPLAKGTGENCVFYAAALNIKNATLDKELGYPDRCDSVATNENVKLADLLRLNPSLPQTGDCSLKDGFRYCVLEHLGFGNGTASFSQGVNGTMANGGPKATVPPARRIHR